MLRWPDRATVDQAVRAWAQGQRQRCFDIERLGYFGSYARGDWGVGSDLDLIIVVSRSDRRFTERPLDWDCSGLPVPADILIYTREEWDRLQAAGNRFAATLATETIWL